MAEKVDYCTWMEKIAAIQGAYPSHPNQKQYDETLAQNYVWPWMCLEQVSPGRASLYDVGCAYGSMSIGAHLLGYEVAAFDITGTYVSREALSACGIPFKIWDVAKPLQAPQADVVLFTEVLEHLDINPEGPLRNIWNILKPGGLLVLSTPRFEDDRNHTGFEVREHYSLLPKERDGKPEDRHHHLYSEAQLRELLDSTGFAVGSKRLLWDGIGIGLTAWKVRR